LKEKTRVSFWSYFDLARFRGRGEGGGRRREEEGGER